MVGDWSHTQRGDGGGMAENRWYRLADETGHDTGISGIPLAEPLGLAVWEGYQGRMV